MPCTKCNGSYSHPKQVPQDCPNHCFNGRIPVRNKNCRDCHGPPRSGCHECQLIRVNTTDRLGSNWETKKCDRCRGTAKINVPCPASYHTDPAQREPAACKACGGTYDHPKRVKQKGVRCIHRDLVYARPCRSGHPLEECTILWKKRSHPEKCKHCQATGVEGGRVKDCADCHGSGKDPVVVCTSAWHGPNKDPR